MPAVNEGLLSASPFVGPLAAGIDLIGQQQDVVFERYVRLVLPLDGFVFWVKASSLAPSSVFGASAYDDFGYDDSPVVDGPPATIVARGSLHYATSRPQDEFGNQAINRVVFTATRPVIDLNSVAPDELYIATWKTYPNLPEAITANPGTGSSEVGGVGVGQSAVQGVTIPPDVSNARPPSTIKIAFSRRSSFYEQAGLYHYEGDAVYPDLETQLVDSPNLIDRQLVVSNSLPVWLGFNAFFPVYPSFLQPFNLAPPYATVHIAAENTRSLQPVPEVRANPLKQSSAIGQFAIGISPIQGGAFTNPVSTHYQLVRDLVRVTLVGVRNQEALNWFDYVIRFMTDIGTLGLMSEMPVMRDEKRGQSELGALAMRKSIEFEVSYQQTAVENLARQLILKSIPAFVFS